MNQTIRLDDGSEVPLHQLLDQALRLHQAGALDEAKPIYERILQALPGQFHALHFLGLVYHQQGGHQRAEKLILQALAAEPGDPDALCNLGAVYNAMQKSAEAVERFQAALAIEPALPAALNGLGSARFLQGRLGEAQVLEHQGGGEAGRVVAARWGARHRPRRRAHVLQHPAVGRGGREHVEQGLAVEAQPLAQGEALRDRHGGDSGDHVVAYLRRLAEAGVPTRLSVVPVADHEFMLLDESLPQARDEMQAVTTWLKAQLTAEAES